MKKNILIFSIVVLFFATTWQTCSSQGLTEVIERKIQSKIQMDSLMKELCQKLDSVASTNEFITEKDLKIYSVYSGEFVVSKTIDGLKEYSGTFKFDEYSVSKNSIVYYRLGTKLFDVSDGIFHSAPGINLRTAETLLRELKNNISKKIITYN